MLKSIVLDDNMIASLINNPLFIRDFPSIEKTLEEAAAKADSTAVRQGCIPCQHRAKKFNINLMSVKKAIVKFTDEDKTKLKSFLKAEKVVVVFKNDKGETASLEF